MDETEKMRVNLVAVLVMMAVLVMEVVVMEISDGLMPVDGSQAIGPNFMKAVEVARKGRARQVDEQDCETDYFVGVTLGRNQKVCNFKKNGVDFVPLMSASVLVSLTSIDLGIVQEVWMGARKETTWFIYTFDINIVSM
ncbi:hypothetical protein RHGRI_002198 [Rhododendron griersonianum]|uniref:Uncharacterized protein n=1 Tax=Rhododendron griersonianum TaxID=479676 RepID=A0AAV6LRC0_9ERIC|nr:hypothetical protein RHGRI_002198 [Rhododendron griersonianum]